MLKRSLLRFCRSIWSLVQKKAVMDHPHATTILVMRMYPGVVKSALDALRLPPIPGELHPYPGELMVANIGRERGKTSNSPSMQRVDPDALRELRVDGVFVVREETTVPSGASAPIRHAVVVEVQMGRGKSPLLMTSYQISTALRRCECRAARHQSFRGDRQGAAEALHPQRA